MLGLAERRAGCAEPGGRASSTRHQPVLAGPARPRPRAHRAGARLVRSAQHAQLAERYTFHPRVVGLDFKALILLVLGHPEQARAIGGPALDEARVTHLVTLAVVLQHAASCIRPAAIFRRCSGRPRSCSPSPPSRAFRSGSRTAASFATGRAPSRVETATIRRCCATTSKRFSSPARRLILPYYYALVAQTFAQHGEPALAAQMLDDRSRCSAGPASAGSRPRCIACGRAPPAPARRAGRATRRAPRLLRSRHRDRPQPGGQALGAARIGQPRAAVAGPGPPKRAPCSPDPRLVLRGLRAARAGRGQSAARRHGVTFASPMSPERGSVFGRS